MKKIRNKVGSKNTVIKAISKRLEKQLMFLLRDINKDRKTKGKKNLSFIALTDNVQIKNVGGLK